jgi:outer membrane protein
LEHLAQAEARRGFGRFVFSRQEGTMDIIAEDLGQESNLNALTLLRKCRVFWASKRALLALGLLVLSLTSCASVASRTSPSPEVPWTPPAGSKYPPAAPPSVRIPPEVWESRQDWTLLDLVDIGLLNNTQARAAWAEARSASAGVDIAYSSYLPNLDLTVNGSKTKGAAVGGRFVFDYTSLNISAGLSFLLFDFGGRRAGTEAARQALAAANWTQNSVIQNVILLVEQNYYQYLAAKALFKAYEANLKDAETNLDAASVRREAGVATVADVLKAKTALSQTRLNLVSTQGLIQTYKGSLASAMGLPANTAFEVVDELPASLPVEQVSGEVQRYIGEAQSRRPDLAAARSQALQAEAQVRVARAGGLPTLQLSGDIGKTYFGNVPKPSNSFTASLQLNIPVVLAFANRYRVLQAEADAQAARAQMETVKQDVILEVWTSYFSLQTAAQRIKTSQDLYDAAQESYQVALVSYKAGVGSILDLLSAQSSLENGRVQLIQAKTDWLMSLAQFAHDTGELGPPDKQPPDFGPEHAPKGEKRP